MIGHDHPAVEAAAREFYVHDAPSHDPQTWPPTPDALADDYRGAALAALSAALPDLTAATPENLAQLRDTPVGRALMAEAWDKFREHYAAEWDEAYPDDIFPSPAPPPAVVSRESVAASMMRHWAERLRADRNPYLEADQ